MSIWGIMNRVFPKTEVKAPEVVKEAREKIREIHNRKFKPAGDQWRHVRGALDVMVATARGGGQIEDNR